MSHPDICDVLDDVDPLKDLKTWVELSASSLTEPQHEALQDLLCIAERQVEVISSSRVMWRNAALALEPK